MKWIKLNFHDCDPNISRRTTYRIPIKIYCHQLSNGMWYIFAALNNEYCRHVSTLFAHLIAKCWIKIQYFMNIKGGHKQDFFRIEKFCLCITLVLHPKELEYSENWSDWAKVSYFSWFSLIPVLTVRKWKSRQI